jgi:hypothetical protein
MLTSVEPLFSIPAFSVSSLHKLYASVENQGNPQIPVELASAAEFQKRNLYEAFGGFVTEMIGSESHAGITDSLRFGRRRKRQLKSAAWPGRARFSKIPAGFEAWKWNRCAEVTC